MSYCMSAGTSIFKFSKFCVCPIFGGDPKDSAILAHYHTELVYTYEFVLTKSVSRYSGH